MKIIDVVTGTRPDAIKLKPLIEKLNVDPNYKVRVISSGQHRDLLPLVLGNISVDFDMQVMRHGQTPAQALTSVIQTYGDYLENSPADLVLVHGDTVTAYGAAMAAFYAQIKIAHVEAGLRSGDLQSPFPEEAHRKMIAQIADIHFAVDELAKRKLLDEGVAFNRIFVTGNSIINALQGFAAKQKKNDAPSLVGGGEIVLTLHRREKNQNNLETTFRKLSDFLKKHQNQKLHYVMHPSTRVRELAELHLAGLPNVKFTEAMNHHDFLDTLWNARFIITDSGGIQEEATALGKQTLLLRSRSERMDGFSCGLARLIQPEYLIDELELQLKKSSWTRQRISYDGQNPVQHMRQVLNTAINQ